MSRKVQKIMMALAISASAALPILGCHRNSDDSVRTPTVSDFLQQISGTQSDSVVVHGK